jgi:hypothetical protein
MYLYEEYGLYHRTCVVIINRPDIISVMKTSVFIAHVILSAGPGLGER